MTSFREAFETDTPLVRIVHLPVLAGSGVTAENVADLPDILDGAIVGTAAKEYAQTTDPVDENRAAGLVAAEREWRLRANGQARVPGRSR